MKKCPFFIVILITLLLPGLAMAQQRVEIRGSDQGNFSRLVFDWMTPVSYTLDQSTPGALQIRFLGAGTPAALDQFKNLPAVQNPLVVSEDPLIISVNIPPQSVVRDFTAGDRVFIDVYDLNNQPPPQVQIPPSVPAPVQNTAQQALETPEPPQRKPAIPAPDAKAEPVKKVAEEKLEEKTIPEVTKTDLDKLASEEKSLEIQDPATDILPTQAEEPQPTLLDKALAEKKAEIGSNIVTLSATEGFNSAVFQYGDELWMIAEKQSDFLKPQVSGPRAKDIRLENEKAIPEGKIFQLSTIEDATHEGEGGGLLWRVMVTDTPPVKQPLQPQITNEDPDGIRGASILWPFDKSSHLIDLEDPHTGKMIKLITVADAKEFAGPAKDYIDFEVLQSIIGLAILPKVDDLEIKISREGVRVSRPGGLAIMPETMKTAMKAAQQSEKESNSGVTQTDAKPKNLFDFENWGLGEASQMDENHRIILSSIAGQEESQQVVSLLTLAKMYISHGMWAEAEGFLEFAELKLPELADNSTFIGLKGVAYALGRKSAEAFRSLSNPELEDIDDIQYWRAYTLADLGDWQQAAEVMPKSIQRLKQYPEEVLNPLGVVLAEIALRSGEVRLADDILEIVEGSTSLNSSQTAALKYLQGEASRQRGDVKHTKELWTELTEGDDDLYRARASLALTQLLKDRGEIKQNEVIDNLERLRYAWRGDELEAQINYWLGQAYFDDGQYFRGLNILREAVSLSTGTDLGKRITAEMTEQYKNLFSDENLKNITPLEAATLYEEFSELLPIGEEGDEIVEKLADHFASADLFDLAIKLLQKQMNHRREGLDALRVSTRLAAIQLIDKRPKDALETLKTAKSTFDTLPDTVKTSERTTEIALLRARALSQNGRPDQAIDLLRDLERSPNVNRLRADIAWNASYWDDAAEALDDVIVDQNIALTRPLEAEDANLIVQRAVALNLASDRIGLANMRERYSEAMAKTANARIFDVITRPRQNAALADRETLMSVVSEVDLFSDFLNNYKTVNKETN